jgi:hypothetical protein
MPRGDQTGPMGMGRMTGRGAGYCAGFGVPGYANPVPGQGFGVRSFRGHAPWGRGFGGGGQGWRSLFRTTGLPGWMGFGAYGAPGRYGMPYQKPDPEMEMQVLKNQAQLLREELASIEKRLAELTKGAAREQQT